MMMGLLGSGFIGPSGSPPAAQRNVTGVTIASSVELTWQFDGPITILSTDPVEWDNFLGIVGETSRSPIGVSSSTATSVTLEYSEGFGEDNVYLIDGPPTGAIAETIPLPQTGLILA